MDSRWNLLQIGNSRILSPELKKSEIFGISNLKQGPRGGSRAHQSMCPTGFQKEVSPAPSAIGMCMPSNRRSFRRLILEHFEPYRTAPRIATFRSKLHR